MAENLWLSYAFLAASIYATLALFDKALLDKDQLGPVATTGLSGSAMMTTFVVIGLVTNNIGVELSALSMGTAVVIGVAMSGGFMYIFSLWTYFIGLEKTDVSRFVPLLSLDLIIVLPLAFVFFNEQLNTFVYGGVIAIFLGTILISLEDVTTGITFASRRALFWGLAVAAPAAGYTLVFEYMIARMELLAIMFWVGIGGLVTLAGIVAWSQLRVDVSPTERAHAIVDKNSAGLLVRGSVLAVAFYSFVLALESGPVSAAIAVLKLDVFLVFFGVLVLSRIAPEVLYERQQLTLLIQKFCASGLILAGTVLIQAFS